LEFVRLEYLSASAILALIEWISERSADVAQLIWVRLAGAFATTITGMQSGRKPTSPCFGPYETLVQYV
jgi:hypothetical protein